MPDQAFKKLRWNYQIAVSTTNAVPGQILLSIRGNGPQDPYHPDDVVGNQPYGWDEMCAWYRNYTCTGSKISVTFICHDAYVDNLWGNYGIFPSTLVSSVINIQQPFPEYRTYSKWVTKPSYDTSDKGAKIKVKNYMTTKKIYGRPIMGENDFAGNCASSIASGTVPELQWFWHIFRHNDIADSVNSKTVNMFIEVKYYVKFWDRRQPINS